MNLKDVLNEVADQLADASQSPFGLPPDACRDLALLIDRALVVNAPIAPPPVVVSLNMWRQRHAAE